MIDLGLEKTRILSSFKAATTLSVHSKHRPNISSEQNDENNSKSANTVKVTHSLTHPLTPSPTHSLTYSFRHFIIF